MLRSELLERDAEARRVQLAETFDELRARVTPGHVLDRLVDYATDSGGVDFFRNLRDQTVANPLALGMIGAGLAWLMLSRGKEERRLPRPPYRARGRIHSYVSDARDRFADARDRAGNAIGETASGVRDRFAEAASRTSETAGTVGATVRTARDSAVETASQWREATGSAAALVRDTTSSAYEQAKSRVSDTTGAVGGTASMLYGGVVQSAGRTAEGMKSFASGAATTSRDLFELCREQPLVMAGLGIALGAAVGAAFRSTQTEHQLMGEASDEIKERTRSFAQEQFENSKSTAEAALDKVQQEVKESSQSLTDHPTLVPSDTQGDVREEMHEPIRPERIGLRDERS
jgi:Protein of unknown function (DUF3618)